MFFICVKKKHSKKLLAPIAHIHRTAIAQLCYLCDLCTEIRSMWYQLCGLRPLCMSLRRRKPLDWCYKTDVVGDRVNGMKLSACHSERRRTFLGSFQLFYIKSHTSLTERDLEMPSGLLFLCIRQKVAILQRKLTVHHINTWAIHRL